MRRATACVLLLVAGARRRGCGGDSSREDAAAAARARAPARRARHARGWSSADASSRSTAARCHTLAGRRYTEPIIEWEAPNLDEVRLKRRYVEFRVEVGGPAMASFSGEMPRARVPRARRLRDGDSRQERRRRPATSRRSVLADGRAGSSTQHCAACHGIAGRGGTGRPVYPGMDFNLVKPSERYVIDKDEGRRPAGRSRAADAARSEASSATRR